MAFPASVRRYLALALFLFVLLLAAFLSVFFTRYYHHHHKGVEEYYYPQKLDHFASGPTSTFNQRYYVDYTHWNGEHAHAPIFVFLGGNKRISNYVGRVGVLNEAAKKFGGLVVYIEHRYYGKSVPYGMQAADAIANTTLRGYLTSKQALADYEEIIVDTKARLSATHSPVILVGGFYGGILATWLMLKSPGIAIGALVASAPLHYFYKDVQEGPNDFCGVISEDFRVANPQCHDLISQSWEAIDSVASQPGGLKILSDEFKTCRPLQSPYELKAFLAHFYAMTARNNKVDEACDAIKTSYDRDDLIHRIADIVAAEIEMGACTDTVNIYGQIIDDLPPAELIVWGWQQCNEFIIPAGCTDSSMIPDMFYNLSLHAAECQQRYQVSPPLTWVGNQYGGDNLRAALAGATGKFIFSNGMKDPYSCQGVLVDVHNTSITIKTEEGSHLSEFVQESSDDPKWLVQLRRKEIKIMDQWLKEYSSNK